MDSRDIMNLLTKPPVLLMIIIARTAGCLNTSSTRPDWIHNVNWQGDRPDDAGVIGIPTVGEYCLIHQKNIMLP